MIAKLDTNILYKDLVEASSAATNINSLKNQIPAFDNKEIKNKLERQYKQNGIEICVPLQSNDIFPSRVGAANRVWSCLYLAYLLRNKIEGISNGIVDYQNLTKKMPNHDLYKLTGRRLRGCYLTRRKNRRWQKLAEAWKMSRSAGTLLYGNTK